MKKDLEESIGFSRVLFDHLQSQYFMVTLFRPSRVKSQDYGRTEFNWKAK